MNCRPTVKTLVSTVKKERKYTQTLYLEPLKHKVSDYVVGYPYFYSLWSYPSGSENKDTVADNNAQLYSVLRVSFRPNILTLLLFHWLI